MANLNSVTYMKNYGAINIRLRELLDEKNMTRYQLATAIDARFEVINNWYGGSLNKIDADILARICYALDCKPSDIIIYKPE